MGKKKLNRRDFFRNLSAVADVAEAPEDDVLFRKYARTAIGQRQYSPPLPEEDGEGNTPAARVGQVTSGLSPYTGTWDAATVMHLLRRTSFGVRMADVTALKAMTVSAAVDAVANVTATPSAPSATPVNNYQTATFLDSGGVLLGADWTGSNLPYTNVNDDDTDSARRGSLTGWSWGLCVNSDYTIREKMVQFWYHFIPVNIYDVEAVSANSSLTTYYYLKLLRTGALGNFKTLIKDITKHPAMLAFLGGQFSTAAQPNENYGRELLELFTMGKVPTQNYTEPDIQAAAKVFSGWRLSSYKLPFATPLTPQPYPVAFTAGTTSSPNLYHNTSSKVFSANFGSTTIANAGAAEFDTFFNMLFTQQAVAISRYICRRLYRFFVYYDIDANVEANVIVPLAADLVSGGWEMLPIVKKLLKSEHFYDMANRGVMIKSPMDFLLSIVRTLAIPTTATSITVPQQYQVWNYLHNFARNNLEQGWLDVPTVSGWKSYYQSPTFYQNWINSNTIQQRTKFLTTMLSTNGTTQGGVIMRMDLIAWVQQFPLATIQSPGALIDAVVEYMLPVGVSSTFKTELKKTSLLGNIANAPDSYWTTAWDNYAGSPANASYKNIVTTRLRNMFTGILELAEAQLM